MAMTAYPPGVNEADRRVSELLAQFDDDALQDAMLRELESRVDACERRYGMPSNAVAAAINAGRLDEQDEVCQWLLDFKMLQRLGAR